MRSPFSLLLAAAITAAAPCAFASGAPSATLTASKGDVTVRAPKDAAYSAAKSGAALADGTRLKTGAGAEATLQYSDGSVAKIAEKSEVIVRASAGGKSKPNGLVLMLGRAWSKVVKGAGGEDAYEVRSANAVAGVRGTEFEVGVGLDGSSMVAVEEGEVAVEGEEGSKEVEVEAGEAVESSDAGKVGKPSRLAGDPDWDGWFADKAKKMQEKGLKVAKSLDGRLGKRKAKVEKLLAEQKQLRERIVALEAKKKNGADVDRELRDAFAKLERVTERLEDMRARLEGAFGLFERWGAIANEGGIKDADKIAGMATGVAKMAQHFADMIEEGTDLSQEGMDEMMDDMGKGKKMDKGDSAADELFR